MLDELTLQRCVDGELSESEHHEFLVTVEKTGSWRELALAFTEEQIWGLSVASNTGEILADAPTVVQPQAATTQKSPLRISVATLALGLLVALTSGLLVGDIWRESQTPTVVDNRPAKPPTQDLAPRQALPSNTGTVQQQQIPGPLNSAPPSSQYVVDLMGSDGKMHQVKYPVYDSPDMVKQYRPQLPVSAEAELLRSGYQLRRRQQMRMVPQDNGGQILFSIELLRAEPIQ